MDIAEIDVHDDATLREWYAVEAAAVSHDRVNAVTRTYDALAASVRNPSPWTVRVLFAAHLDGRTVGTAELALTQQDNAHLVDLQIQVLPELRRLGIGRRLHEACDGRRRAERRTTALSEVYVVAGETESPGLAFSRALGYVSAHVEDHLALPLPVPGSALRDLAARVRARSAAYEIVTWGNRCPDELAAAYCDLKTQMGTDVPIGEIDWEPTVYTEERMRSSEERTARSHDQLVAAARRRSDGALAGYSQVYLAHGTSQALQDDTLVMPEHRGHRLGTALKLATLEIVQRDHPDRQTFHTWTDPDNPAMYRTNTDFGYLPVERLHEVQRKDA